MKDIIFSNEINNFVPIATKLGVEILTNVAVYPTKALLTLGKAGEHIREQIEQWPIDAFFGLELLSRNDVRSRAAVNDVLLVQLAKKQIIILFMLRHLFDADHKHRVAILEQMRTLVPLCRKYHVFIALATGARTPYELRSAHDLLAFGALLGMTPHEAAVSLHVLGERVTRNKRKAKGELLPSGVIIQPE